MTDLASSPALVVDPDNDDGTPHHPTVRIYLALGPPLPTKHARRDERQPSHEQRPADEQHTPERGVAHELEDGDNPGNGTVLFQFRVLGRHSSSFSISNGIDYSNEDRQQQEHSRQTYFTHSLTCMPILFRYPFELSASAHLINICPFTAFLTTLSARPVFWEFGKCQTAADERALR